LKIEEGRTATYWTPEISGWTQLSADSFQRRVATSQRYFQITCIHTSRRTTAQKTQRNLKTSIYIAQRRIFHSYSFVRVFYSLAFSTTHCDHAFSSPGVSTDWLCSRISSPAYSDPSLPNPIQYREPRCLVPILLDENFWNIAKRKRDQLKLIVLYFALSRVA